MHNATKQLLYKTTVGIPLLQEIERIRLEILPTLDTQRRSRLGQFMTPAPVARFMASLFSNDHVEVCKLLDPGAGVGALTSAFLERWTRGKFDFDSVEATAFEIDKTLAKHLEANLNAYEERFEVSTRILVRDFIKEYDTLPTGLSSGYTHAVINPPYRKIGTGSAYRAALSAAGVETVNLYSGFVALALSMMAVGGEVVAIIPRSFCNGPYYRPFRDFLLSKASLEHIHLFKARDKAFRDDAVLQENVILRLKRGGAQGRITVSTSTDESFSDYSEHSHPFDRIVLPGEEGNIIHVPTTKEKATIELLDGVRFSLKEIDVQVSTGPVVDFRMRPHLRDMPEEGSVPLLYPAHFAGRSFTWPLEGFKKANAIARNEETAKWLWPNGFYVLIRRFSSKEEKRRVVASVVDPDFFPDAQVLGFENHFNVLHFKKAGLPKELVHGLAAYLNSTAVDEYFRRFNGHTQVNATDLKLMKYPSREMLCSLGYWRLSRTEVSQIELDEHVESLTA